MMRTPASLRREARPAGTQRLDRLPRLLRAGFAAGPASLAEHLARYGPARSPGLDRGPREALIGEVQRSGLTGRGGARFPTARKLAAVAARHSPVVVRSEEHTSELQS